MTTDAQDARLEAVDASWQRFLDALRRLPDGGGSLIPVPDEPQGEPAAG